MLRISDAASLAIHTMVFLAKSADRPVTTHEIASALDVSENHLAKVHQRLAKAGLVGAVRGPNGGFSLGKSPRQIKLLEIYEAIEGALEPSECLLGRPTCGRSQCIMGELVRSVNIQVSEYFSETTLFDLVNEGGRD
jgi:Rrf2 family protein